jgi:hypothetical protein
LKKHVAYLTAQAILADMVADITVADTEIYQAKQNEKETFVSCCNFVASTTCSCLVFWLVHSYNC